MIEQITKYPGFYCCILPFILLIVASFIFKRRPSINKTHPRPTTENSTGNANSSPDYDENQAHREDMRRIKEEEDRLEGSHQRKVEREEENRIQEELEEEERYREKEESQRQEDEDMAEQIRRADEEEERWRREQEDDND